MGAISKDQTQAFHYGKVAPIAMQYWITCGAAGVWMGLRKDQEAGTHFEPPDQIVQATLPGGGDEGDPRQRPLPHGLYRLLREMHAPGPSPEFDYRPRPD